MLRFSVTSVLCAALVLTALEAQAQQDSRWRLDYSARMGWGSNIIVFLSRTAVDPEGNQYVAGTAQFADLPTTNAVIQPATR